MSRYLDVGVLRIIEMFTASRGYPPTFREIARVRGISLSTVAYRLEALRAAGRVAWEPGSPRTLRVLDVEPTGGTVEPRAATGVGDEAEA